MNGKLLAAVSVVALAADLTATASADVVQAPTNPLLRDCSRHGSLTHPYTAHDLRRTIRSLPPDIKKYSTCPAALRSQLSGVTTAPISARIARLYRDFAAHGYLTRAYSTTTLRRALRHVPPDLAQYTFVTQGIKSQLALHRPSAAASA
jgi:hypothetical protein